MTAIWWKRSGEVARRPGPGKPGRRRRALVGAVEALEPRVVMATFSVTSAADAGPGSLRDAIVEANRLHEPNVIEIDPSVTGPIVLSEALPTIVGELEIAAPPGNARVTIMRNPDPETPPFRILTIAESAEVTLRRLTITGGEAEFGGGILNDGRLDLHTSEVSNNVATAKGGGIYNTGRVALLVSTVRDNVAEGVRTIGFGPAGIGRGGGIYNKNFLIVASSTVSGNRANREGGAVWNEYYTIVSTSTIADNSAESFVLSPAPVPIGRGGAIYNLATVKIDSSTIAGNFANQEGGGIFSNVTRFRAEPSYIRSSILADNAVDDITVVNGTFESQGFNLVGSTTRMTPDPTDLVGVDPMLAPLGNYGGSTMVRPPLPGSPAINAGRFDTNYPVGQRGIRREPGTTDIGADEARTFSFRAVSGLDQSAAIGQPFADPLVAEIRQVDTLPPEGGLVTFRAPAEGPSAIIVGGGAARLDAEGLAQVQVIANNIPGSYTVVAETASADRVAEFTLTNVGPDPDLAPTPGVPAPASSAQRPLEAAARQGIQDLRAALPRPTRFTPSIQGRTASLARSLQQSAEQLASSGRPLPPALARWLDQLRSRA